MDPRRMVLSASTLVLAFAPIARADLTFNLDFVFSSAAPSGAAPWLSATFKQVNPTTVRLTLRSLLKSATEFVDGPNANANGGWYFNLSPAYDPASLSFVYSAGLSNRPAASGIDLAADAYKADGDGFFDIRIRWSSANRFGRSDVLVYDVTRAGGLLEADFNFLSSQSQGGNGPFYSAAHVQGIPDRNGDPNDSGWIAPDPIPAPGAALLGAVGLGLVARLRRAVA